jgi:hypothetical protein
MRKINRGLLLAVGAMFALSLFSGGKVHAAGAAAFSVEGFSTIEAGKTMELSLYVTVSGADVNSSSVILNFSNFTYVSFSDSGKSFSLAIVTDGDFVGSTSVEVVGAFTNGGGAQGKLLMGKLTVQAAGSAGTGNITLSNPKAYDNGGNLEAMDTSVQNKSVTLTQPPAATCPSGQVGTPPNCSTPTTPPTTTTSPSTNATTTPNQNSTASVPKAISSTDNTGNSITSNELKDTYDAGILQATAVELEGAQDEAATTVGMSDWKNRLMMGGILVGVLAVAAILLSLVSRRMRAAKELNRHISHIPNGTTGPINANGKSADENPPEPPKPPQDNGPTIIRPQQ